MADSVWDGGPTDSKGAKTSVWLVTRWHHDAVQCAAHACGGGSGVNKPAVLPVT